MRALTGVMMLVKRLLVTLLLAAILLLMNSNASANSNITAFSGIVVDDVLAQGVSNARVKIFNGNPAFFSTQLVAETITNEEGKFSCSDVYVDNNKFIYVMIEPNEEYYPTTVANIVKVVGPGDYTLGIISVKQKVFRIDIKGAVIDDIKGIPLEGCKVSLFDGNPQNKTTKQLDTQLTEADGTYFFERIAIERDSKLSIVVSMAPVYEEKTLLEVAIAKKPGLYTIDNTILTTLLFKASINGLVIDDVYSKGISYATVRIYDRMESDIFRKLLYEAKTNEAGQFTLADKYFSKNQSISVEIKPPTEFDKAFKNNFAIISSDGAYSFGTIVSRLNTIEIALKGALIDDSDGQRLENGNLSIQQNGTELAHVSVATNGSYERSQLEVKRDVPLILQFAAKGCYEIRQEIVASIPGVYSINLPIERHTYLLNVDGRILDDINSKGIQGALVKVTSGNWSTPVTTNIDGYFSVEELEIDTRITSVINVGIDAKPYDSKFLFVTFVDKTSLGLGDIYLYRNQLQSNISGRIIDNATKKGVPKATVVLMLEGKNLLTTQTDSNGNYTLTGVMLPRNTDLDMKITASTYDDVFKTGIVRLDKTGQIKTTDISISKTVYYSFKLRGIIADYDSKSPILNAIVSAYADGKIIATALTNSKGEYLISNAAVKRYSAITVLVDGPTSSSYKYIQGTVLKIPKLEKPQDSQNGTTLITKSEFPIVITGQCFEPIGQKYLKNVKVSVELEGKVYSASSNDKGSYSLSVPNVKRGSKILVVHSLGGYRNVYKELVINIPQNPNLGKVIIALEANLVLTESNIIVENGFRYVTGILYNNSSYRYEFLRVYFKLYDGSGALVGNTSDSINGLEKGEKWRFKALILDRSAVRYSFDGISYW